MSLYTCVGVLDTLGHYGHYDFVGQGLRPSRLETGG